MKAKIIWLVLSVMIVLAILLASCATDEDGVTPPTQAQYGGTINLYTNDVINSPNPMQPGPVIQNVISFAYEKLGVGDWTKGAAGTGELDFMMATSFYPYVGALAESWEEPDPTTYIIHLRKGIHWHNKPPLNGRELTADDVAKSLNNQLAHPEIMTSIGGEQIKEITALDKYKVQVKTNKADIRILRNLFMGYATFILPIEMDEEYGDGWSTVDGVCGTGPYIMTDFASGSSVTFKKNPEYWAYDELNPKNKLPYADTVNFYMITDKSTYLSALRTAKVDAATSMLSIDDANSLKTTSPDLEWTSALQYAVNKVNWRQDLEDQPFSDIKVRKALSMAIDRETIIRDYRQGQGLMISYPLMPQWKEVYTPFEQLPASIKEQYEYNTEKAKQLLTEAGYPNGFKTEAIVDSRFTESLQILTSYWKDIGVDCEIKVVDPGTWRSATYGKTFPAITYGSAGISNADTMMETFQQGQFFNYVMFHDPVYDDMVNDMLATTDESQRNNKIKELNLYFWERVPTIVFPPGHDYYFWWPWLKNYNGEPSLSAHNPGGLFARVWVDQELKQEMGH